MFFGIIRIIVLNLSCVTGDDLQPSRTALLSAAARAAHVLVDDDPALFLDDLAERVLGTAGTDMIRYHRHQGGHPILAAARVQATLRSRFAEAALRDAVGRGVDQYLLLGAGLDTFGVRSELARSLLVVEVDHPATQRWKRSRLADTGLDASSAVRYVDADLTADAVLDRALSVGLDASRPVFVSWLGGVPYFRPCELSRVLSDLARLPPGSELVADYHVPPDWQDDHAELYVRAVSEVASDGAEPWRSSFTPDGVAALLAENGFVVVTDHSERDSVPAGFWERRDGLRPGSLMRLVHARRTADG